MKTLLIGGARSGKSSLAVRWAGQRSSDVCCIVTGIATDEEMAARIDSHRGERPQHWRVREEPVQLGAAIRSQSGAGLLLIDCLSIWTANCLWPVSADGDFAADVPGWRSQRNDLLLALREISRDVILVSNEVGAGIVPDNQAARLFGDEHGWLNQVVAAECDEVFLITAGLPLRLKPEAGLSR